MDVEHLEVDYRRCPTCGGYHQADGGELYCSSSCQEHYLLCQNCHRPFIKTGDAKRYCQAACKVRYGLRGTSAHQRTIQIFRQQEENG